MGKSSTRLEFRNSWFRKFCYWILNLSDSSIIRWSLFVIVASVPSFIINGLISGDIDNFLVSNFGKFGEYVVKAKAPSIALMALLMLFFRALYALVSHYARPDCEISREEVATVISALTIVVEAKESRFRDGYRKFSQNQINKQELFLTITKPLDQLALLTKAVYEVFDSIDKTNSTWKIRLCRVKHGAPFEWLCWEPTYPSPRSTPQQLNNPNSTINNCIKTKTTQIVEDIKNSSQKGQPIFLDVMGLKESGSLLCAPIIDHNNGEVALVLCISGSKAKSLQADHKELYDWILNLFMMRMSLEYALLGLREKAESVP